jgi:hypothetical protein
MVEELCYKSEGLGFEIRSGEWISLIYIIIPTEIGPRLYSVYQKWEYQKQKINVYEE